MKKIYLAGHKGMVGSAIFSILERQPDLEIITYSRTELDLCDLSSVCSFIKFDKPVEILFAAARVGGIFANNTFPAEFIYRTFKFKIT